MTYLALTSTTSVFSFSLFAKQSGLTTKLAKGILSYPVKLKYQWMFEVPIPKNNDKRGKGLVLTSRTYASPKLDGNLCPEEFRPPVSMSHPSQMLVETFLNS